MDDYAMYDHPCNATNEFCKSGQKYQVSIKTNVLYR